MAHRSWCAETGGVESNERLEFLGDAVLGLVVTDHIFRTYPALPEGHLAQVRAAVVNAGALAEVAEELELGRALLLGKGENASGGRQKPSILADAMEAVIGAVYLDGGLVAATDLVLRLVGPRLDTAGPNDHKSLLHERIAKERQLHVQYEITGDGPEHDKTFRAVVIVDGRSVGVGVGRTKKQAEQAAARDAWQRLATDRGTSPAREEPSHG